MTARILVVDDVPANVRLLEARLTSEYYDVKTVCSGREVLGLAESWQPDVILLDVMMPEMNGHEVCALLKARQSTAHIPVVMISALKDPRDRREGLSCGADEFLTKPIEHEILLARLRGIIRLKQLLDEWRARGATAAALGLRGPAFPAFAPEHRRVLIVDDLAVRAARLRDVLKQSGIAAMPAADEAAALEASAAEAFDLITVSLSPMVGDPLRLVAKLRAAAATRDTPLLLIAEADQRELLIAGLDLGASDCVMLPLDESEFLLRVTNHISRKHYQDRLRTDVGSALQLAVIDPLTGLFNRRYLTSHLERLCTDASVREFAVLMIDVDHFKTVNDRFGHPAGDSVLQAVAETFHTNLRKSDLVCRYGGEEFVAVVGGVSGHARVVAIADKLRSAIEQMRVGPDLGVTVSIGVAMARPPVSAAALMKQADSALYEAKRQGRNRVALFDVAHDRDEIWGVQPL